MTDQSQRALPPKVATIIGPLPDEFTKRGIQLALPSRMTYYIAMIITELRRDRNDCTNERAREDQ